MKRKNVVLLIGLIFLLLISMGKLANIYGDFLWFNTLEYSSVFWITVLAKGIFGFFFGAIFFLLIGVNIYLARKVGPKKSNWELTLRGRDQNALQIIPIKPEYVNRFLFVVCIILSLIMGIWPALLKWDELLRFLHQAPFNLLDPIFHKDIGFFVFSYPVYIFLQKWLFFALLIIIFLIGFIYLKDKAMDLDLRASRFMVAGRAKAHLSVLAGFILLLIAWDRRLKIFGLLYSPRGAAFGAGYTDMHAQLIAYWIILVMAALCAFLFWINISAKGWKWPLVGTAVLFVLSLIVSGFYPWALQKFIVEPNELTKERPYIEHNIRYTRWGYNLDQIEEEDFPAYVDLNLKDIQKNSLTLNNVKLWDKNPLKQTYGELQEMRLYYNFINVDEDRYNFDGEKTQVMLSARELNKSKLPPEAQTWENIRFKYTHGYGLCMSPVNQVTEKGLPNFIIKDIPPVTQIKLPITRPEIYYGEMSNDFVIVNTSTQEFDYPKGDSNVYTKYQGKGGVPIGSFINRLVFSLKYSDPKILLTSYITPESRIMLHRRIKDRVTRLAPFLTYDRDPYLVVSDIGHLYWIQDAYTCTDKYPYSERFGLPMNIVTSYQNQRPGGFFANQRLRPKRINYIRNSVKVVIDAYNGATTYYITDEKDPIIRTFQKIFPDLFKPFSKIPENLRAHIRYPRDLFEIQANMYGTYHMRDTQVFYNQEDLWDLPLQKDLSTQIESTMKGYYLTMRLPDREREEFLLMVPFTPDNKSNMIAWMGAQCDGPDYGKILVYKFPKKKLIYGPRQVEARIDQQTEIARELTLWNQQGSEVFRGDLLVIPIEKSILYIEPVYLTATDQSQLPELKRVIVAFGEKIVMKNTLSEGLQSLFGSHTAQTCPSRMDEISGQGGQTRQSIIELAKEANRCWQQAVESLKNENLADYGRYQEQLHKIIQTLIEATK